MHINKTKIISTVVSVAVSTLLVAGVAFAITTIGTGINTAGKVAIGTDAGATGAVALSGALGSDFGLQTYTQMNTDIVGWYAANNAYMTVSAAQTGNTSGFGSISELDLGRTGAPVDLSGSRNYGAMWADLEILGATTLGASTPGTPLWTGALVATVIGSNTQVNSDYRQLAGVVVDSNLGTSVTPGTGGSISGILIRKSLGKTAWPVGLLIDSDAATLGIDSNSKVRIGGTGANAIALSNAASPDWGLETNTKVTSDMGTWYGAANSAYMTVSSAQTGNTSIFGTLSELDLGSAVDLSGSRNYGAVWGDLEILGATTLGASTLGTPLWTGALVGTVIGSGDMVVSNYRQLAGLIVDSNITGSPTVGTGASISGILIRKSVGKNVWPVGLLIDSESVTADIQLSSGVQILTGTDDPNGSVTAANGSVYIRAGTGNEDTTIYTNTDGGTTWAAADL